MGVFRNDVRRIDKILVRLVDRACVRPLLACAEDQVLTGIIQGAIQDVTLIIREYNVIQGRISGILNSQSEGSGFSQIYRLKRRRFFQLDVRSSYEDLSVEAGVVFLILFGDKLIDGIIGEETRLRRSRNESYNLKRVVDTVNVKGLIGDGGSEIHPISTRFVAGIGARFGVCSLI